MSDTQCAETPLSDHVARFWRHLETETVRILIDMKRAVGLDIEYWDSSTFSDDVAKALVSERAENEQLRNLVQTLIDNDPTEPVADSGETVLDAWRQQAKIIFQQSTIEEKTP